MQTIHDNDCYGERKKEIVENYYLTPQAYLKLIPGQKKTGCCGELTEKYLIFSYTEITNI